MMRRPAAIFDMDGTLADVSRQRREHLLAPSPSGWPRRDFTAFHADSVNAPANRWVVEEARRLDSEGVAVLVVTARKARWRNHTAMWMALNGVPSERLYMRADDDQRKDYLVKSDILRSIRAWFEPVVAFDDNPSVLRLWQESGIPVVRVPGWEE